MSGDALRSTVAQALTGESLNFASVGAWNSAGFVRDLAALGWDRERLASVADEAAAQGRRWPFAVPPDEASLVGAAQLRAALDDVQARLELTGQTTPIVSQRTALTADERRLLQDVPPHYL